LDIDSRTQLYGVLGHPIDHSLSPVIHNAAFRKLGINAVYTAMHVQPEALGLAFEGLRALEVRGANLTIPFKETAIEFIDEIPEDVDRAMGAINTIVNVKGQLHGYNTDGPGFLQSLHDDLRFNPEGKTILVLGAGGAARSVVFALARAHSERILILNRTRERAEGLAEVAKPFFPETSVEAVFSLDELRLQSIDLVVNTTSCGMKGDKEMAFDLSTLKRPGAVYDLVYSPLETPLLKSARALKWNATNGLGMLVNQAALAFALWTGKKDGVANAMREALDTCLS
jgi:shikimate dehydrogenase